MTQNTSALHGRALADYIREHLDRNGQLQATDDAAETLAKFDREHGANGGSGLNKEQVQEYLDTLGND